MAFIEPMNRNKPNITYLLTLFTSSGWFVIAAYGCFSQETS